MSFGLIDLVKKLSREMLPKRAIFTNTSTGGSLSPASYRTNVQKPTFNMLAIKDWVQPNSFRMVFKFLAKMDINFTKHIL